MNRMIALFQRRADEALKNFCIVRANLTSLGSAPVANLSGRKEELEYKATKHSIELQVWQKAADLLRKEEMNHGT